MTVEAIESRVEPQTETILVIDDDELQRVLARAALEQAGYRVLEAANGLDGLALTASAHPKLVLLDVKMPGIDGFEVCSRLRALPEATFTPVLMMTGLDDVDSIDQAYGVGATDFTVKPVNWPLLAHRIGYVLRASRDANELRASRTQLTKAQRMARLGYWEWYPETDHVDVSAETLALLGWPSTEAPRDLLSLFRHVHPEDRGPCEALPLKLRHERRHEEMEFRVRKPNSELRYIRQLVETDPDERRGALRFSATVQDVTDQRLAEAQIRELANYDTLTRLPNRRFLTERLERMVTTAHSEGFPLGVFFLDFDRFKRINDGLGHPSGDELLRQVAARLRELWAHLADAHPERKAGLIGRFGGDEFVLALPLGDDGDTGAQLAEEILATLRAPYRAHDHQVVARLSIGIARFPDDGEDVDTLLRKADAAMYRAKRHGGDGYRCYDESAALGGLERLRLERELSEAVANRELVLHYQPQFDQVGTLVGAEALVRWQHPRLGLLHPKAFIPLAEETGLILPIGSWVLEEACQQSAAWARLGEPLGVSVNLSARQLDQPDFLRQLEDQLRGAHVSSGALTLELTETLDLTRVDRLVDVLRGINASGIGLAIDDFGTGYSSLAYLKHLPVDAVKIDPGFLQDVPLSHANAGIVRAIVAIARALDIVVIAEGVETAEQRDFLRDEGCDIMQGFFLGRPMPAADITALLEETTGTRSVRR